MKRQRNEKGSLALEQVLFIGAVTLLTAGLFGFYSDLGTYFDNVAFDAAPTGVGIQDADGGV